MRNGILLAEDAPQNILSRFEVDSLEDAFLQLCMKHGVSDEADHNLKRVSTQHQPSRITDGSEKSPNDNSVFKRRNSVDSDQSDTCCGGVGDINCNKKSWMKKLQFTTKLRMKALLAKNFLQMVRQPA